MFRKPSLAGGAIFGHRALRQMAALVGANDHTTRAPDHADPQHDHDRKPGRIPHGGGDHITRVAWRRRADPLYTSRMKILSFLLVTLTACAGTQEETSKPVAGPVSTPTPAKPAVSGDVSFEIPVVEIKGALFEPDAIGRPDMPLYDPKRPTTLDKQRALVQGTKDPVQKQAYGAILATMLYRESRTNKAAEKALLTEARQVLRDVAQLAGAKAIDEVTLWLLGSYELALDDFAAAEKAWQALLEKDPKNKNVPFSKDVPFNPAWLVYTQLKQFKNAEALATVTAYPFDEKQPELAYVTAWAKWRTNDISGAWQALTTAAKGWGQNAKRDELERDLLLFASRSNIPLDQAMTTLTSVLTKTPLQQYDLLAKFGISGLGPAGRWADGVAVLDKAIAVGGSSVQPNSLLVVRYSQADFTVRLDAPEVAVTYAKQAMAALTACGAKCDKERADFVRRFYDMGRLFHNLYATANDRRYYQPAKDLYEATIPLFSNPSARGDAQKISDILEKTFKNTKAGTGTHDKGNMASLLAYHNAEIQACYEAGLSANSKLGGTITLNLESDASGAIKGVSTEPNAGLADLPAVAGCVADHAKQWKLPKRGMPGSTRIKMSYGLSVMK